MVWVVLVLGYGLGCRFSLGLCLGLKSLVVLVVVCGLGCLGLGLWSGLPVWFWFKLIVLGSLDDDHFNFEFSSHFLLRLIVELLCMIATIDLSNHTSHSPASEEQYVSLPSSRYCMLSDKLYDQDSF